MFRTAGLASAWMAAILVSSWAWAQDSSLDRRSLRDRLSEQVDKIGDDADAAIRRRATSRTIPGEQKPKVSDRVRELSRSRIKTTSPGATTGLDALGAKEPFAYSARGNYLVAAVSDGDGLALWETKSHRRLRRLENSERGYSLVAISDDGRWIAAVPLTESDEIDLWRADSGRHVRAILAAEGAKQSLAFEGSDRLRVVGSDGRQFVFSIPAGVPIDQSQTTPGGSARRKSAARIDSPRTAMPAAPPTTRSAPLARPRMTERQRGPSIIAEEAPQGAGPPEPRTDSPAPSFAAPPRAGSRVKARAAAPPPSIAAQPPGEPVFEPAAPPPDEPAAAAPAEPEWMGSSESEPAGAEPGEDFAPDVDVGQPRSASPEGPEESGGGAPEPEAQNAPPVRSFRFETEEPPAGAAPLEASGGGGGGAAAPEPTAAEPPRVRAFRFETERPPVEESEPVEAAPPPGEFSAPPPEEYNPSGGASPDSAADEEPEPHAESAPPARSYRFEMDEPTGEEPHPAAAAPPGDRSTPPPATAIGPAQPVAGAPKAARPDPSSVRIHYATNRNRLAPADRTFSAYFAGFFGSLPAFIIYGVVLLAILILPWFGKRSWAAGAIGVGALVLCAMGSLEAYVRSQLRDDMTGERYGCRPTDISYGSCEISVPPPQNRRPGDLSRPVSVWVFEAPENPDKHFMLRKVEEHKDKDAFYHSLSAQLAASDVPVAMLFVHGYNVSFEDAIFRTAQLAVDLKFPGAAMTFCWPSYADPVKYTFDEQNAEVSIPALCEVLEDLATRSGAKSVHIIAHSMGNRVLAGALRSMDPASRPRNREMFQELVLAAPDIDSRVFQSQVLPHIIENTGHCTLYASSRDRALLMSRCFHNYQRLGETQPELVLANGLDTIDASLVDTSLLGHSYIGDVQSIVSDLHDLVVGGKRASERLGLQLIERNALKYWSIVPEMQTATDPPLTR